MDPCECIWDHEFAMRRLLNLLRNSQSLCTDSECFATDNPSASSGTDNILLVTLIMVVTLFLFFMRPRNARNSEGSKPVFQNADGAPPNPPPTAM